MGGRAFRQVGFAALLALVIAGCSREAAVNAPPRADDDVPVPTETSVISIPVDADASLITRLAEREIPRELWSINQHFDDCVPTKRVKVLGKDLRVTPKLGCDVVGRVTRGPLRLRGEGQDIIIEVPIKAVLSARDIGGVLKGETATGAAMARARIRLDVGPDWSPQAKVSLAYNWKQEPGIDFLGQRIRFTGDADEKLRPLMRSLERELPRELAKVKIRPHVERLWKSGFTSLSLNARNPPVWMRLTPQKLHYGGYSLGKGRITLDLGLVAVTETFVGDRPPDPEPLPLPSPDRGKLTDGLNFYVPVVADYAELEPVILRALDKRARRPFDIPAIGNTYATFEKVEVYGAQGGRIAAGISLTARSEGNTGEPTRGKVWLTAKPRNEEGSAQVLFDDVEVTGDTNGVRGDLLVTLASQPSFAEPIADALKQNFSRDLEDLEGKIKRAIAEKREGDLLIRAEITDYQTGVIRSYGKGLYLPVRATGKARVRYVGGL